MPELDPNEVVTLAHKGVLRRIRRKRSALKRLARAGWYEVGPDAPVTGKQAARRRAAKSTAAKKAATPEQVSGPTTSPVQGEEEE